MRPVEYAASEYIEEQFKQIAELFKFEQADTHTAEGMEAMLESMLNRLVTREMLFDYLVKSIYCGSRGIYTSIVFKVNEDTEFILSSFTSHERFIPTIEEKNETNFMRAMKGV